MAPVRTLSRKSPARPVPAVPAVAGPSKPNTAHAHIPPPPKLTKTPKKIISLWHDLLARRNLSVTDEDGTDYDDFPELDGDSSDAHPSQFSYPPYVWDEEQEGEGAFERYKRLTAKMTPGKRIDSWREEQQNVTYDPTGSPVKTMIRNPAKHLFNLATPKVEAAKAKAAAKRKVVQTLAKANKENRKPSRRRSSSATKVGAPSAEEQLQVAIKSLAKGVRAMADNLREAEAAEPEARPAKRGRKPAAIELPVVPASGRKRKAAPEPELEVPKKRQRTASAERPMPAPQRQLAGTRRAGRAIEAAPAAPAPKYTTRQVTVQQTLANMHVTRRTAALLEAGRVKEALHLQPTPSKPVQPTASKPKPAASNKGISDRLCKGCGHVFAQKQSLTRHAAGPRARPECRA